MPDVIKLADDQILISSIQRAAETLLDSANTDLNGPGNGTGYVFGNGNEGQVSALGSPGMAVRVQNPGVAYDNTGTRKAIPTTASLAISAADVTNPRNDAVVLNAAGALAVRAGTPAPMPSPPGLTNGDVVLALVTVAAGAANIQNGDIKDMRNRGSIDGRKIRAGSVQPTAIAAAPRSTLCPGNGSDTKFPISGGPLGPMINPMYYYGVHVFRNGARISNKSPGAVSGLDEYRVIEEGGVTKVELGAALPGGQNLLVDWTS